MATPSAHASLDGADAQAFAEQARSTLTRSCNTSLGYAVTRPSSELCDNEPSTLKPVTPALCTHTLFVARQCTARMCQSAGSPSLRGSGHTAKPAAQKALRAVISSVLCPRP